MRLMRKNNADAVSHRVGAFPIAACCKQHIFGVRRSLAVCPPWAFPP
jgi:hypothetical protein